MTPEQIIALTDKMRERQRAYFASGGAGRRRDFAILDEARKLELELDKALDAHYGRKAQDLFA